jgi:glycosyltransferase involved in cell wall biosynthesis
VLLKLKILLMVTRLNIGGPALQTLTLARGLPDALFETTLVSGALGSHEGDMHYIADALGVSPLTLPELSRELAPLKDWRALMATIRLLRTLKPHMVHTHTAKAGTIGRLAVWLVNTFYSGADRIRVVHTFHGHTFHSYFGKIKTAFFQSVERLLARCTDRIIAISPLQKEDLCNRYGIAKEKNVTIIPLGLDLSRFTGGSGDRRAFLDTLFPGTPGDIFLSGLVGRLTAVKNPHMVLAVAGHLKRMGLGDAFRFVMVGDGELRNDLMRKTRELGLEQMLGFTGWRRDTETVYAALDAVLLTSLNEGTPICLIEAMASGKPVIATDVGGVGDLMGGLERRTSDRFRIMENGLCVASNDAKAMAMALIHMKGEREHYKTRAANGIPIILKRYAAERMIEETSALYGSLLGR